MANLKYFGRTVTNQNPIHDKINSTLNMGNVYYHSLHNTEETNEIIGGWNKLRNQELHNLHSLPNKIITITSRRMRRAVDAACMGAKGKAYRRLVGKPEEEGPLGRFIHRW